MMLRRILNAIPFLALLSLTSLLGAPNAAGATHDVDIQGFAFNPKILPIQVGDTVRWTNLDAVFHTATSDAGVWDSGTLMQGDSFSFKFNMPGDYVYHCSFHPLTMKDAHIIVQGSLGIDADQIPETAGGTVHFFLDAGTANGNRNYLLLGSISGTVPGTPLPGGSAVLPLNWDLFTNLMIPLLNTPVFQNFMGTLNAAGQAQATLNLGPVPGAGGLILYFAYALNAPWDFASNAVSVEIVP